jgi:muramoyltetrapeptide carboxypeptidase
LGLVAPASRASDEILCRGREILFELNIAVKEFGLAEPAFGNFSASDRIRRASLEQAFLDEEVDAVLCVRGGYGSGRIVDVLDFDHILLHSKPFIGYSDITLLLHALHRRGGTKLFHGPMLVDLVKYRDPRTIASLLNVVSGAQTDIRFTPEQYGVTVAATGFASGPLIGGNLAVLVTTLGTSDFNSPEEAIVFLEDTGEFLYRIDRNLDHLRRAGYFDRISGLFLERCWLRTHVSRTQSASN